MSTVHNPVLPGTYPDPSVCRVGDDYYLVSSTFEYVPGLPVHRSRDLVHWEHVGFVIDRPGMLDYDGVPSSDGLYAPTLRHHDGTFWLVCTFLGQREGARGGNFVVTATDPAGPWSDPVWLDVDGIDPSLFFDDDGRVWAHGTRGPASPEWPDQTEVWVRELDPATMTLVGPESVVWNGAVRGAVWAEGPHIYRHDGAYYLLAAEGGTEFHHAVSVARADSVTGPYTGYAGNPVLTHRHLGRGCDVVGVGHADLVQGPDCSWWALLLAMRPYGGLHVNLGRETFLVPVEWQDGWPVVAPGVGRVGTEVDVPFAGGGPLGVTQGGTSGAVLPGDPRWTSLRGLPSAFATPRGDGWDVRVLPAAPTEPVASAFLGLRQQHADVDVRATVRVALADGEDVGLMVRQSEDDHVRVFLSGGPQDGPGGAEGGRRVVAVHRRGGVDTVVSGTALGASSGSVDGGDAGDPGDADVAVVLAVRARGQGYALLAGTPGAEPVEVAVVDGRTMESMTVGGFVGLWVGVFATSNGAPTGTVAHVERFEYVPAC